MEEDKRCFWKYYTDNMKIDFINTLYEKCLSCDGQDQNCDEHKVDIMLENKLEAERKIKIENMNHTKVIIIKK